MEVETQWGHIDGMPVVKNRQVKFRIPVHFLALLVLLLFLFSSCSSSVLSTGSWQASELTNQHIYTLAVNPENGQVIYAGNESGNVFVSTDAGQHWTARHTITFPVSSPITTLLLSLDPSGKRVYAATNTGLLVSTDNAQSWHVVGRASLPLDTYTVPVFVSTKQVYVGTAHHGMYASNDAGATWHTVNEGLPSVAINGVAFDAVQHRLWLATSLGIYRSDNEGISWHSMSNGLPARTIVTSVQPAASAGGEPSLVYVGTTKGFYLSHDSGAHWSGIAALQYVFIRSILIDFRSRDAATVYVCTNAGAFRSDDNGQTWGGSGTGIPRDQAVYELAIGAKQASQLYAASNNVYLYPGSSGAGIDWTRLLSLLTIALLFTVLFFVIRREVRRNRRKPPADEAAESSRTVLMPPSSTESSVTSSNGSTLFAASGAPRYRLRRGRGRRATRR